MKTLIIWTLGVAALCTLVAFIFMAAPKMIYNGSALSDIMHWGECERMSFGFTTPQPMMATTIAQMKHEGWVIDDYNADSCGNIYIILKRPRR